MKDLNLNAFKYVSTESVINGKQPLVANTSADVVNEMNADVDRFALSSLGEGGECAHEAEGSKLFLGPHTPQVETVP